jgi:hypothetical protein
MTAAKLVEELGGNGKAAFKQNPALGKRPVTVEIDTEEGTKLYDPLQVRYDGTDDLNVIEAEER